MSLDPTLYQWPGRMRGVPMYKPAAEKKRVCVTVEPRDLALPVRIVLWRGWTVKGIRDAAKKAYPNCDLQFGTWF